MHAEPCFAKLDETNSKQCGAGLKDMYVTDAVAHRLASCYRDGLWLSSCLSAQLNGAMYKLDRDDHSAYVTAAANMEYAMHTWTGSSCHI